MLHADVKKKILYLFFSKKDNNRNKEKIEFNGIIDNNIALAVDCYKNYSHKKLDINLNIII